jgi:TolB protein
MNYAMIFFQRMPRYRIVLPFVLVSLFFIGSQAPAERIQLDIANSGIRKLIIAVPPFVDSSGDRDTATGKELARLMMDGLRFHGFVQILDPRRFNGQRDAAWRALGADYVFMGDFNSTGSQMTVAGSLLDVMAGNMLAAKQYKGMSGQRDDMTLRLVDAMIQEFTGELGISRTSIAFISDNTGRKEVYIADVLGRDVRQITRHNHLCVSPRFTSDGRRLAYSSYHRGNQDLYITELDQKKKTRTLSRREGMNLAPAFSPDSRTAVVTLSRGGNPDLYLIDMKGNIVEQLTDKAGINVSASFSPDGRSICFVSDRGGRPQVYIMNMQNKQVRRLTFKGKENVEPSWSPKGDKIVYTSLVGGRYHIFTIPVNSATPRQLTSGYGNYESPTWSPDGKQVAFSRKRKGKKEVCAVFANGEGMRVLFTLKGNQSYPRWSPRLN